MILYIISVTINARSSLENETEGGDDEESNEDGAGEAGVLIVTSVLCFYVKMRDLDCDSKFWIRKKNSTTILLIKKRLIIFTYFFCVSLPVHVFNISHEYFSASAPINTMQSLLFTEQLQSNSRGAHGERLDVDLPEISPQVS